MQMMQNAHDSWFCLWTTYHFSSLSKSCTISSLNWITSPKCIYFIQFRTISDLTIFHSHPTHFCVVATAIVPDKISIFGFSHSKRNKYNLMKALCGRYEKSNRVYASAEQWSDGKQERASNCPASKAIFHFNGHTYQRHSILQWSVSHRLFYARNDFFN